VYGKYKAKLKVYAFIYNKKSKHEGSMANVEKSTAELTWGVCYEIDLNQFNKLKNEYEKGYDVIDVWVETDEGNMTAFLG
jgi:hypothetical protein